MSQPEMGDKPASPLGRDHEDHPEMISRNSRNGLILFTVYCVFYAGFVLISAFAPHIMARPAVAGVNLAIIYGFSLIIGALFLAAIYMYLCRPVGNGNAAASTENSK